MGQENSMAEQTKIEWADSTFNPWIGCTKISPACDNCYAENLMDIRLKRVQWGAGNPRRLTSSANWNKPLQWNAKRFMECGDCGWRGEAAAEIISCGHCGAFPLQDARRRVFCASLADVFDNEVQEQWKYDLWRLIHKTPHLDWLLLTKRIGIARQPEVYRYLSWPSNVWLGITVVNQEEADRDIPKLLQVPAAVRFLSIEPMLGPVDLVRGGWSFLNALAPPPQRQQRWLAERCGLGNLRRRIRREGQALASGLDPVASGPVQGGERAIFV
jgi:protein gp37